MEPEEVKKVIEGMDITTIQWEQPGPVPLRYLLYGKWAVDEETRKKIHDELTDIVEKVQDTLPEVNRTDEMPNDRPRISEITKKLIEMSGVPKAVFVGVDSGDGKDFTQYNFVYVPPAEECDTPVVVEKK